MMGFMSIYLDIPFKNSPKKVWKSSAQLGQGGLIAIAVVLLITLTVGGGLLGSMSQQNANQAILTAQNAQAYYAAQAGVQEAIATRMLPRSNYLNFDINRDTVDGIPYSSKAYYRSSGRISKSLDTNDQVIAKYRYMVLGGDSARRPDGSYYGNNVPDTEDPYLLSITKISDQSPFIVVSEGIICHASNQFGKALVDKFVKNIPDKVLAGECQSGYTRDQVIVVAAVNLLNPDGSKDKIISQNIYKDASKIRLPAGTFVPGKGWIRENSVINFNDVWKENHQTNNLDDENPLTLKKIVVYNFTENRVIRNCEVEGPNKTSCGPIIGGIPKQALAFRLYFNGPFDFRSISPNTRLTDTSLEECKGSGANDCHLRIMPQTGPAPRKAYSSNIILPLYPGGTQIIVLPPLKAYGRNDKFSLEIDTTKMRSFNGERGRLKYSIDFQAENK